MHVVGTAGHVDHGKSTLVEALTGIDPDRLKEEKDRQMTIDLGFAWLKPGDGQDEIGIIDVPGHRDFIENMLAGVAGIDLALLVIAADEGVMPQTKEHLAILDLLEVNSGFVVLTKVDLIDDPDWLELVILDVHEALEGTLLAEAPIFQVSAVNGDGLDSLRTALITHLNELPPRYDEGLPRLPIDRVFSLSGFGSVVTGTLVGGSLRVGEAVEIQPAGKRGRIRGLQTHKTTLQEARPGSRVAVNISGLSTDELKRGDVLSHPGSTSSTILCDARYRHLPDVRTPLQHNEEVKLFVGAAEVIGRVRVLGEKQIGAGEQGWVQLALREALALSRGDRFILRRPSPGETLGGGQIVDPHPGRKHRRFKPEIIHRLESLAHATPYELMFDTVTQREPIPIVQLIREVDLDKDEAGETWQRLINDGIALAVSGFALSATGWEINTKRLVTILETYHTNNPLRLGIPREEMRSRLRLPNALFNELISTGEVAGYLIERGTMLRMPAYTITFTTGQQVKIDLLIARFAHDGVNSPSVKEAKAQVGPEIYHALLDIEELAQVNEEVVYLAADYSRIVHQITNYLEEKGQANAAQIRDLLQTSRKYAIALLEHLDDIGVTRREGDNRILRK